MKGLINRIIKWWNDTEIDTFSVATVIVFIGVIILFALNITETEKLPSKDEICQKHFGKDYVWREGYRGSGFCVGDSGIPKYPKSWR